MKEETRKKLIKELIRLKNNQSIETNPSLNTWYSDLDNRQITPDAINAMALYHDNETITEGRIYLNNLAPKE